MYVGIAIIAFPYTVHWVGVPIAIMGVLLLASCSLLSAYMLFKARNKYKRQHIIDLPDLGYVCFGEKMKFFCQLILVVTQISIDLAYLIYLGEQAEIVVCDLFDRCDVGKSVCMFFCMMLMTPACLLPDYQSISYYSGVFTIMSYIAFITICGYSVAEIQNHTEPLEYTKWEPSAIPLFLGQTFVLFEGNACLLNVYAEHKEPRKMFTSVVHTHVLVTVSVLFMGFLAYYAYGPEVESVILFNMPQGKVGTIFVQLMMMVNIMGSFVIQS